MGRLVLNMSEILLTIFLKHDQSQNIDEIQGIKASYQKT